MNYEPVVIEAKYLHDFKIEVTFSNGERKLFDCEYWLNGEVFQPLKDKLYFRRFFVDGWTISWPNGADFAPETLYDHGTPISQ